MGASYIFRGPRDFTLDRFSKCEHFRKEFEKASYEFDQVQFVWVNCGQAVEFCRSRQPPAMPWVELFQLDFEVCIHFSLYIQ